jgi:molybdate transport system substrate-binding protein
MRALIAVTLGLTLLLSQGFAVQGAEVKVIGSTGVASTVVELGRQFEAKSGHRIQTDFAVIAVSKRKIDAGAAFDIAILSPEAIESLIGQRKIAAGTRTEFGRTGLGVGVRKGAAKPDISTTAAFKATLLTAKSVSHSTEGLSGVAFRAVLDRLGIAAEMKPKLRAFSDNVARARALAAGEIELVVTGVGPVLAMAAAGEADFVGTLPAEIQDYVVFTAGVSAAARDPVAARSFLQFMTSPAAAPVFKATGMERG